MRRFWMVSRKPFPNRATSELPVIHPRSRVGPCRIALAIPAPTFLSASFHTLFVINFVLVLVLRFPKTLKRDL
jgi:hypothetical protein